MLPSMDDDDDDVERKRVRFVVVYVICSVTRKTQKGLPMKAVISAVRYVFAFSVSEKI